MKASKRARATDIPMTVKRAVYERDRGCCIFCGRRGSPNAHVLSRAHGGLGVEKNIVTACTECHEMMDNSVYREIYLDAAKRYLAGIYGAWDENEVKYGRK